MFSQLNIRKYFFGLSLIACIFLVTLANLAKAEPSTVTLFAAGSLTDALSEVATAFTQRYEFPVKTVFGPSGQLRGRLENGEHADVFALC
jgi:ABC-type molybdate transport system substrate-binding protein